MRLRNKKTGEIVSLSLYGISLNIRSVEQPTYHSIGQLCEDWEDYKPTEPPIKDKKKTKTHSRLGRNKWHQSGLSLRNI